MTVGAVTTAITVHETPVTLANIKVALLGLLVALAIVDCTEFAVAVVTWMLTPTMTLPDVTVTSTIDGLTPARAAIAIFIWSFTLGVNEETSPVRRRLNPTTLIAGGEGCGEGGRGDGGDGELAGALTTGLAAFGAARCATSGAVMTLEKRTGNILKTKTTPRAVHAKEQQMRASKRQFLGPRNW